MVLPIFLMTAMVPTIIGVNEASKGTRNHEDRRRESARKQCCQLLAQCMPLDGSLEQRSAIHNAKIYLGPDSKASQIHSLQLIGLCPDPPHCILALGNITDYQSRYTSPNAPIHSWLR